jgi:hypothetical protein
VAETSTSTLVLNASTTAETSAPAVTVCMSVVVMTCTLVATSVTVIRIGAVGQMSGVVVLFSETVGVAEGIEEFPVGSTGEVVMFSDTLGVKDGAKLVMFPVDSGRVDVEFSEGTGVPTDATVKPVPMGTVKLPPNGGGTTVGKPGGALVVTLLEGLGRLEDGAGPLGLVPAGAVELAETGMEIDPTEELDTPLVVTFDDGTGMEPDGTSETGVLLLRVIGNGDRGLSELVNGGPVEDEETFRLALGVALGGRLIVVLLIGKGDRGLSELVNGGPLDDEETLRLALGVLLGGRLKNVEFAEGAMPPVLAIENTVALLDLLLKFGKRLSSVFENGGPVELAVEDTLRLGLGVTLAGGITPPPPVENIVPALP